jgi:hypothetical protein
LQPGHALSPPPGGTSGGAAPPPAGGAVDGVRLSLGGLTLRRDSFSPAAGVHASRLAASAASLEVDDVTPGARWARVLGHDAAPRPAAPREAGAPAARLVLRAVRPAPAAAPALVEYRLHAAALPLRLRLDQARAHTHACKQAASHRIASHCIACPACLR